MEKYVNFIDHPAFTPMLNPKDMMLSGIHGGTLFSDVPESALQAWKEYYKDLPWHLMEGFKFRLPKPDPALNSAGVLADHKSPITLEQFDAKLWFMWYTSFFFATPEQRVDPKYPAGFMAKHNILGWAKHILAIFEGVQKDPRSGQPILTQEQHQTLIEVAWNPFYFPIFKIEHFKKYEQTEG